MALAYLARDGIFFFNGITALEYGRPVNTVRKVQKFISKLGLCQSHLSRLSSGYLLSTS